MTELPLPDFLRSLPALSPLQLLLVIVIVIVIVNVLVIHAMQCWSFPSTRARRHPEMLFDTSVVSNTRLSVARKEFGH